MNVIQNQYSRLIRHQNKQPGFSIIELVTVMAILGLILATVSFQWMTPLKKAQFLETVRQIQSIDLKTRGHTRSRHRDAELRFDLKQNKIHYTRYRNDGTPSEFVYQLPEGVTIEKIKTPNQQIETGQYRCLINRFGMSESYSIQMKRETEMAWVSFAGGTGQSKIYEDESKISYPQMAQ